MDQLILASECDVENEVLRAPEDVKELFEYTDIIFSIGPIGFTRNASAILSFRRWPNSRR